MHGVDDHSSLLLRVPRSCVPTAQVTGAELRGAWSSAEARDAVAVALGGCAQLGALMRETLQEAEQATVQ